jgi:hypothetical protein
MDVITKIFQEVRREPSCNEGISRVPEKIQADIKMCEEF